MTVSREPGRASNHIVVQTAPRRPSQRHRGGSSPRHRPGAGPNSGQVCGSRLDHNRPPWEPPDERTGIASEYNTARASAHTRDLRSVQGYAHPVAMRTRSILLAGVGICAVLAAWILSSPPMSGPDEAAHLIRAVSAAEGQWTGKPVPPARIHNIETANTRSFTLPADLAVVDASPCFAFKALNPASCRPIYRLGATTETSYVATYYPLFYVPLGVAARLAGSVPNAIYAERAVSALLCALFLLMAFAVTCTSAWSRAAWFLAAGPLTFFVASSAATNGIEVAASICLISLSLEFSRRPPRISLWLVWTIAGVALASAKSLGPLFLVFDLVAVVLLTRPWSWWWDQLRRVPIAVGLVALAAIANVVWSVDFTRAPNASPTTPYSHYLSVALREAKGDVRGYFSLFGWINVNTAAHLWLLGSVTAIILIGSALIRMSPLARWKYLAIVAVAGLITLAVTVSEIAGGFEFQARYTLAIVAPLGLLAVAAPPRDDDRATRSPWHALAGGGTGPGWRRSALPHLCIALMIIVNAAALYGNAQRYAVGERGSIFFLSDAKWSPPGGWWFTTLVALVGLGTLAIAGFLDPQRAPRSQEAESIAV